jgi:hypothetical protein
MIEHGPLLEKLLEGGFICTVTDEHNHRKLQDENLREDLNHFLRPLNRRIAQSEDGTVYFLAYKDLNESARSVLTSQFNQTIQSLMPMLDWMLLVQEALGHDGALTAGDTIKLQEFALKVEDNQSLKQRLATLSMDRLFNSKSDQLDMQIKLVFKRIKELGYLHQPHKDRQIYFVTGKIEHLVELVRFIKDEENLPLDEDAPDQGSMF